jgi:hypothetical protein
MVATYAIAVRSLGADFDAVRVKASSMAAANVCLFWWKPEIEGWHRFVFTSHDVALLFVGYLESDVVGKNAERVRFVFVSPDEVRLFAEHCVYMRSVYEYVRRLFVESNDPEQSAMRSVAPIFFDNLAQVFTEFLILAACRVTDPWKDRGRENFVVELFTNAFERYEPLHRQLSDLQSSMAKHRSRIERARHKLTAHGDRETIKAGEPLGAASWAEWDQFWKDLGEFVSLKGVCQPPRVYPSVAYGQHCSAGSTCYRRLPRLEEA